MLVPDAEHGTSPTIRHAYGLRSDTVALERTPQPGQQIPAVPRATPPGRSKEVINALSETADKLNRIAHSVQRNLSFTVDEPTGRTVIRVMDTSTGETVRQIPTEEALALAQHLDSIIEVDRNGLLFRSDV